MSSRSKWEDMISAAADKINEVLQSPSDVKAKQAADSMGTGMANQASESIKSYSDKQKKAMEDLGI